MYLYIYIYMYIHVYILAYIYIHPCIYIHTYIYINTHAHIYIYIHLYIYICIYRHIYTYGFSHMHMYRYIAQNFRRLSQEASSSFQIAGNLADSSTLAKISVQHWQVCACSGCWQQGGKREWVGREF